jgi:cell division protein FtsL
VHAYWRPQLVSDEQEQVPVAMRGTPEIYFTKAIDNSRLVRVADPRRAREMMQFAAACALLFVFAILYAWQHFSAIEYGYRIESSHAQVQALTEENNQLRLEQAALRNPQRIDQLARQMGMIAPQVGQVVGLEPPDAAGPQLARANAVGTSVAP